MWKQNQLPRVTRRWAAGRSRPFCCGALTWDRLRLFLKCQRDVGRPEGQKVTQMQPAPLVQRAAKTLNVNIFWGDWRSFPRKIKLSAEIHQLSPARARGGFNPFVIIFLHNNWSSMFFFWKTSCSSSVQLCNQDLNCGSILVWGENYNRDNRS